ncbi:unnamed protein product [Chrysodeixis includens]|uniref:Uncharacterized protein n=1 Tax=Chrysodeixis includens TaxID=689277 RepID=A0A9N8Q0F0_CHRIL|nr:unnamed protein product [Chrysodeixis includens]
MVARRKTGLCALRSPANRPQNARAQTVEVAGDRGPRDSTSCPPVPRDLQTIAQSAGNGNHDQKRMATRYGEKRVDAMNMLALILPGLTFTYQTDVKPERGYDRDKAAKNEIRLSGYCAMVLQNAGQRLINSFTVYIVIFFAYVNLV